MKKRTIATLAMMMMLPAAAHAKTAISDSDMGAVTGQAGVSIDLDVRMDLTADTVAWGQNDGTNTNWIGMKNFGVNNMTIKLRPDLLTKTVTDQLTLAACVADPTKLPQGVTIAMLQAQLAADKAAVKPFTIDVATSDGAAGKPAAGTSYVRLGLGSIQVAADSIDYTVALGKTANTAAGKTTIATSADLSQELGSSHIGGFAMDMNGNSTVDIYSTNPTNAAGKGSGVVFDLAVTIDRLKMDSMSWGNTAGSVTGTSGAGSAAAATTAGYVGLAGLSINNMTVTGPVSIQVGTVGTDAAAVNAAAASLATAYATNAASPSAANAAAYAGAVSAYYYSLYNSVGSGTAMGSSFVHIGLGTGNSLSGSALTNPGGFVFGIGSMIADVKVADNNGLTGGGTYGTMGINNMKVGMNGWINIGTH